MPLTSSAPPSTPAQSQGICGTSHETASEVQAVRHRHDAQPVDASGGAKAVKDLKVLAIQVRRHLDGLILIAHKSVQRQGVAAPLTGVAVAME